MYRFWSMTLRFTSIDFAQRWSYLIRRHTNMRSIYIIAIRRTPSDDYPPTLMIITHIGRAPTG